MRLVHAFVENLQYTGDPLGALALYPLAKLSSRNFLPYCHVLSVLPRRPKSLSAILILPLPRACKVQVESEFVLGVPLDAASSITYTRSSPALPISSQTLCDVYSVDGGRLQTSQ